jgi:hypothetical protein
MTTTTPQTARELLEKATPLPWEYGFDDGSGRAESDDGGWIVAGRDRVAIRGGRDDYGIPHGVLTDGDAALIVYAVNRLPLYERLVAELRELDRDPGPDEVTRYGLDGSPGTNFNFLQWKLDRVRAALAALDDPVDSSTPTPPDSGPDNV